ncbi:uncharacterized protein LOC112888072 isoform X2 [Panicum hallii]|uniref:uncharacterized protein LOC112888072 isoform X2 n=1 Tax=Panicum hallii TaxID=206008 RepID=UPI000DF4CEB1|nr:uncharacterized protein LOC112888072 isoform X2 [Panicum hallii]
MEQEDESAAAAAEQQAGGAEEQLAEDLLHHFEQVLDEQKSTRWSEQHVADNYCFHYRRYLLLAPLDSRLGNGEDSFSCESEICLLWKQVRALKGKAGREAAFRFHWEAERLTGKSLPTGQEAAVDESAWPGRSITVNNMSFLKCLLQVLCNCKFDYKQGVGGLAWGLPATHYSQRGVMFGSEQCCLFFPTI